MIPESQLKLWKEAASAATPGPWEIQVEYCEETIWLDDAHCVPPTVQDLCFIDISRTAVPELIAEVERLAKENDRYRSENKVYNEQFLKDKTENERLNSVIVSMANGRSEFRNALREARAEIERLRSGYLTDEQGNEYVQVCILKEKIREQEAEIGRLRKCFNIRGEAMREMSTSEVELNAEIARLKAECSRLVDRASTLREALEHIERGERSEVCRDLARAVLGKG